MDIITRDELRTLVEMQTVGCICISIYLPTYRAGRSEVQQNPVRLKKQLRDAQERLLAIGLRQPEVDAYLQPAQRLLEDSFFWTTMSDGLAIFLSKDYFHYYRLPTQFPEMVVVANRFHIKPLLPLLTSDGPFYVMAISQKTVRLLHCTRFGFNELNISGKIPQSLAETLKYEDVDRQTQYNMHFAVPGTGGRLVSGHGDEVEETKEYILRFFYLVDRGLQREFLHNETAPLVLVSVDYLFPIYKKANTYEHLINKAVEGSPDKMTLSELHQHGVSVMEPYFKQRQDEALRRYREFAGLKRSTSDLGKIVSDSYHGRVYILFIANNQQKWGSYDPFEDRVEIHSKEEPCDVDLLDFVAAHTLAHRGDVYAIEAEKIPDGALAAAVLRYKEIPVELH